MVNKSAHPEQLFEYLNGAVDSEAAMVIAAHLSICDDCVSVAAAVRMLKEESSGPENAHAEKDQISNPQFEISNLRSEPYEAHPAVSELASFFYSEPNPETSSGVATHVARCVSCADAIAQYSLAERISEEYKPGSASVSPAPQKAWELIRDWEESSFAKPKPASEVLGHEMLNRLFHLLDERTQPVEQLSHAVSAAGSDSRVPVLVVNSSGDVRSVEFFEPVVDATGAGVLRHAEGSQRFDNRVVHALLDYGEKDPVLISELIEADTMGQRHPAHAENITRRVDYFIIEERD